MVRHVDIDWEVAAGNRERTRLFGQSENGGLATVSLFLALWSFHEHTALVVCLSFTWGVQVESHFYFKMCKTDYVVYRMLCTSYIVVSSDVEVRSIAQSRNLEERLIGSWSIFFRSSHLRCR